MLQKSRNDFYFLQHENLFRVEVVIRATNNPNLQCNTVTRQVEATILPVLLDLYVEHVWLWDVQGDPIQPAYGFSAGRIIYKKATNTQQVEAKMLPVLLGLYVEHVGPYNIIIN